MSWDSHAPKNLDRAKFIQNMAQDIRVKSSLRLIRETSLAWDSTESELDASIDLLEESLRAGTVITKPQVCDPADCNGCFFSFMCMNWNSFQGLATDLIFKYDAEEQEAKEHAERQKKLHTPQTWNAETLSAQDKPIPKPFNLRENEFIMKGWATDLLGDKAVAEICGEKMSRDEKATYDKITTKVAHDTRETVRAEPKWDLTEEEKRKRRLQGYP